MNPPALGDSSLVQQPVSVVAVLLIVLAILFALERHKVAGKLFKYVPLLVFAYFTPAVLSNIGVIPLQSDAYGFIKKYILPMSLVLLILPVDVFAIARLGRNAVLMFLTGTVSVILGGPLAYLAFGWLVPESIGVEAWKGLAALSGSWIGGGANFVAVGASVGALDSTLSMMVVVDVAVANVWMAALLYFAGQEKRLDEKIGADRSTIDRVRLETEQFQGSVARVGTLADLLSIFAIGLGVTVVSTAIAGVLPNIGSIINGFTWVVLLVTTFALGLSFTPLRKLEGAGASRMGSVFLYLLFASIGANAEFRKVLAAPALLIIAAAWISLHALSMFAVRRLIRAPVFFLAVGWQANIGGAASAPVVAAAFHPSLAPIGVVLAIGGYVLGTYGGLLSAALLEQVHLLLH